MHKSSLFVPLFVLIFIFSCELREEKIEKSQEARLTFSTDTVLFDTLLTERLSFTKRIRIYNPNKNAIEVSHIYLGKGDVSDYQIIVGGKTGSNFLNKLILGKDSLLILVKVNVDPRDMDLPYLIKDSLVLEWNGNEADIKLISWGQDAIYLGGEVICDQIFTADRPYVFYDTVLVDQNCHLEIMAGANLYFDSKAALLVWGRLTVAGDSGNRITFRNSRFDQDYIEAPGQWPGINIVQGSTGNIIDYAIIENAISGITIGTPDTDTLPDLIITHSIIRHVSQFGIIGFTSDIIGQNLLVHDAGQALIFNVAGGNYSYEHCTFSNEPSFFFNDDPAVQFADFIVLGNNEVISETLDLSLVNNIIWGPSDEGLLIVSSGDTDSHFLVSNNIIKTKDGWGGNFSSADYNFPGFTDPTRFNFQLDSASNAIGKATAGKVTDDLNGNPRDASPDLGAYERIE